MLPVMLLSLTAPAARALQDTSSTGTRAPAIRVFLDCQRFCDDDYLQTEIPWVRYVRDRNDADVHVLVTRLGTGGGGQAYTVDLVGRGGFSARHDTLQFVAPPGSADDAVRSGLTRTIALGLVPFASRTVEAAGLRVTYEEPDAGMAPSAADDPWNAWVYRVGASGSFDAESQQRQVDVRGDVSARRITAEWKIGVSADGFTSTDRYELEDGTVTDHSSRYGGGAVAVKSLGPHWGAGAQTSVRSSTYDNLQLAVRAAPAVEYSLFPYAEATRRQLTLQYSIGISHYRYREETIFDRMQETRPTEAFVAGYDVQQPWGSADATLQASNYLDDFSKHSIRFDGSLDLRIVRGLSLSLDGSASLVRDQLSLVKRDATDEEILLRRRALATSYRYSARVGLSYTFGSIFSSVVNPRFGDGPGRILR